MPVSRAQANDMSRVPHQGIFRTEGPAGAENQTYRKRKKRFKKKHHVYNDMKNVYVQVNLRPYQDNKGFRINMPSV